MIGLETAFLNSAGVSGATAGAASGVIPKGSVSGAPGARADAWMAFVAGAAVSACAGTPIAEAGMEATEGAAFSACAGTPTAVPGMETARGAATPIGPAAVGRIMIVGEIIMGCIVKLFLYSVLSFAVAALIAALVVAVAAVPKFHPVLLPELVECEATIAWAFVLFESLTLT
jgi:hypothetical protein